MRCLLSADWEAQLSERSLEADRHSGPAGDGCERWLLTIERCSVCVHCEDGRASTVGRPLKLSLAGEVVHCAVLSENNASGAASL